MTPLNTKIKAALAAFLKERRKSRAGGGWAPFTETDEQQLHELIEMIVEAKFEPDADGDRPCEFSVVNRTRYERAAWFPIPYTHNETTVKGYAEALSDASSNLNMAQGKLDIMLRIFLDRVRSGKLT